MEMVSAVAPQDPSAPLYQRAWHRPLCWHAPVLPRGGGWRRQVVHRLQQGRTVHRNRRDKAIAIAVPGLDHALHAPAVTNGVAHSVIQESNVASLMYWCGQIDAHSSCFGTMR